MVAAFGDTDDPKTTTSQSAAERLDKALDEVKAKLSDVDLNTWQTKKIKAPWGSEGAMEVMAHGLITDHFLHHKMQLFMCLKLLDLPVDTGVLYMGFPPGQMES